MGEIFYESYFFKVKPLLLFTEVERKKGHKEKERVIDCGLYGCRQ